MRYLLTWMLSIVTVAAVHACVSEQPPTGPPSPGRIAVITAPSTGRNRIALQTQPAVRLFDASGSPARVAGVIVTASMTSGGGSLAGTTTAATNSDGTATFGDLTLVGKVGARGITFSAAGYEAVSTTILLEAGAASSLSIHASEAAAGTVAAALHPLPVVRVSDADSNAVSGVAVLFEVAGGGGRIVDSSRVTDAAGLAAPGSWILGTVAGENAMTARVPDIAPLKFTATAMPGPAAKVVLSVPPADSARSRVSMSRQPVALLQDDYGNAVPTGGVLVRAVLGGGPGVLTGADTASTDAKGVAAFSSLGIRGAIGRKFLYFSSGLLGRDSARVMLGAGDPATLRILDVPLTDPRNRIAFAVQPRLQLEDLDSNTVAAAGLGIRVAIDSGGGSLLGPDSAVTDARGIAAFYGLAVAGTTGKRILAFSGLKLTPVTTNVTLRAGEPKRLAFRSAPSSSARSRLPLDSQPVVQIQDEDGNAVHLEGVGVSIALGGDGALLGPATAVTSDSGAARFAGLAIAGLIGSRTLIFSAPDLSSITAPIALRAGEPVSMVATAALPDSATVGTLLSNPAVRVNDADGNPVSGITIEFAQTAGSGQLVGARPSTDSTGIARIESWRLGDAAGPHALTATSPALPGVRISFAIVAKPIPVASVSINPVNPTILAGGSLQLTAAPLDSAGGLLANRPTQWASSNPLTVSISANGLISGIAVGTAQMTATVEGKTNTVLVTVAPTPIATLVLDSVPADSVLLLGSVTGFAVTAKDANGNVLPGRTVSWTTSNRAIASVGSTGVVRADSVGAVTVTATAEGKSASVALEVRVPVLPSTTGTVELLGGNVTLTVPPLSAPAGVTLTVGPSTTGPASSEVVPNTTYAFGPAGTTFDTPLTLTLKYDSNLVSREDRSGLRVMLHVGDSWVEATGSTADTLAHTVTTQLSHFSHYGIGFPMRLAAALDLVALNVSGTNVHFTSRIGGAPSLPMQCVRMRDPRVESTANLARHIGYAPGSMAGWLTADLIEAGGPRLEFRANPAGIAVGTHTAKVVISSRDGTIAPRVIDVRLRVAADFLSIPVQAQLGDCETTSFAIYPASSNGPIDPSRPTWIVIHGRINSPADVLHIANVIRLQRPSDQVLVLDWSHAASKFLTNLTSLGERWIQPTGLAAAEALKNLGFADKAKINLVGHSWGSYVADELAEAFGGVNVIVALDPAANTIGSQYNVNDTNTVSFQSHSEFALAIHSSCALGNQVTPTTADLAIYAEFAGFDDRCGPSSDDLILHGSVRQLFAYLVRPDVVGGVSRFFSLDRILGGSVDFLPDGRRWDRDAYADNGASGYEARIFGADAGTGQPNRMTYRAGVEDTVFEVEQIAASAPQINALSPVSFLATAGEMVMVVEGKGFQAGAALRLIPPDGPGFASDPSKLSFVSGSRLQYAFNNLEKAGTWAVEVRNTDGQASTPWSFNVVAVQTGVGKISARLHGLGGNAAGAPGSRQVLHPEPVRSIRGANPAGFTDVAAGTRLVEGYFTGTFFGEEFWTSQRVPVTAGQTIAASLMRNHPYATQVVIKDDATGATVNPGQSLPLGTRLRAEVTVRNDVVGVTLVSAVRFLFDRNRAAAYDADLMTEPQSISGSGGTRIFTLSFTPVAAGPVSYALAVYTTVHTSPALTDSWTWNPTITIGPVQRTLNVQANLGAAISVAPSAFDGAAGGTTPFARTFVNGTEVSLTASSPVVGAVFDHWEKGTANLGAANPIIVTMDADVTIKAVYRVNQTISGKVTSGAGIAVSGATISFSGSEAVTTDSDGSYSKIVAYGYSGTATPSKTDCVFLPAPRTYTNVVTSQSNQDYVATCGAVGGLAVTLKNGSGQNSPASSTRQLLYTTPLRSISGSNPTTFTNVGAGTLLIEGYATGTFFGEEFWTSRNVTVIAGQTTAIGLTRNYPYATTVVLRNDATGALLTASQNVAASTRLRADVTVRNDVPGTPLSTSVRLLLDRNQLATYDIDLVAPVQTIAGSGGTATYTFTFTPTAGTYSYALAVHATANANPVLTDSWTWTPAISVGAVQRTLIVQSELPATIIVSPLDVNGAANGSAPLTRTYSSGTPVTVTAPSSIAGAPFHHWDRGGANAGTANPLTLTLDADVTLKAIYAVNQTISGKVLTSAGSGVGGVTISLTGHTSVVTGTDGSYTKTVAWEYSGTAKPSKAGCTFTPGSRVYTSVTSPQPNHDFTAVCGGAIASTLKDVSGSSAPSTGARQLLYTPALTSKSGNPVTFGDVQPGSYLLEGYFTGTFFGEEFWTSQTIPVTEGQTANVTLNRNYPTVTQVVLKNDATGATLTAGQSIPLGTRLRADVTVRNDVPGTTLSTKVRVLFDRNQAASYDSDQTTATQTISGSGSSRVYSIAFTPSTAGTYSHAGAVYTTISGSAVLTDSWTWTPAATITVVQRSLTVQADLSASMTVSPADLNGSANGTTTFTRSYASGTVVSVTAASPAVGAAFDHWEKGGTNIGTANPVSVTMDADYTLKAIYRINQTISGKVSTSSGVGVGGVTVAFSGTTSATTGSDGTFTKTVSYGYSGTITPSKSGCSFTPSSRSLSNVVSPQTGQNFTAACGGTVNAMLRNINLSNAASGGTRHLLYTSPLTSQSGNPTTFSNVPAGTYLLEGYSTGTFFGEEFWTSQNVSVTAGQTTNATLTRNYPYATQVLIKNDATGATLSAGQTISSGTRLRAEITVRNDVPGTSLSSSVRFLFDRSKTASYDSDQTTSSQTISGSGGTRVFTVTFTPTLAGTYHYALAVRTSVSSSVITDSWTWNQTVTR